MKERYNISNARIPEAYENKELYYGGEFEKLKSNGFSLNMKKHIADGGVADVHVGDKFYVFKDHNICAFKVSSIIFSYGNRILYDVIYADGDHKTLSGIRAFKSVIDCRRYQECVERKSGCPDRFYNNDRIRRIDFIEGILSQLEIEIYNRKIDDYYAIGVKKWYSSECGISIPLNPNFKYLWVDKDGLHFELMNKYTNPSGGLGSTSDKVFYDTKKECDDTHKVIDFDDDSEESQQIFARYFNINTTDDVTEFFKYIAFTLECSLYPGDDFLDMINIRTEEPMFSKEDARRLNRYMDACFRVCTQHKVDIYAHAINITC